MEHDYTKTPAIKTGKNTQKKRPNTSSISATHEQSTSIFRDNIVLDHK